MIAKAARPRAFARSTLDAFSGPLILVHNCKDMVKRAHPKFGSMIFISGKPVGSGYAIHYKTLRILLQIIFSVPFQCIFDTFSIPFHQRLCDISENMSMIPCIYPYNIVLLIPLLQFLFYIL